LEKHYNNDKKFKIKIFEKNILKNSK
jgi:hypothetical protein